MKMYINFNQKKRKENLNEKIIIIKKKSKTQKREKKQRNKINQQKCKLIFIFAMITLGRTEITINFFSQNEMS